MPYPLLTIKRKWRSRGHGVHSPFAFRFITEVLHQSCDYYAYEDIDSEAASRRDRKNARRLYRIILGLQPAEITILGSISAACLTAIALAQKGYTPESDALPLLISSDGSLPEELPEGTHIVAIGKSPTLTVEEMLFAGHDMSVAVAFRHLPKQTFTVDI